MQIIKYEINKTILTVGFKENNFVVYSQIAYDSTKSKQELLQTAYTQCKNAIEFEKTQTEHSFTSTVAGETFTPDPPKASTIALTADKSSIQFIENQATDTVNLTASARDQYGNTFACTINFSTNYGTINGNALTIPSVTEIKEISVTASVNGISDAVKITVSPYVGLTLAESQQAKIDQINDLYAQKLTAGFPSSATGTAHVFGYGTTDQMKFMRLTIGVLAGVEGFPTPIPAKDNEIVFHTQAEYMALMQDIALFDRTTNALQHQFIDAVNACTTIEEVNGIVVDFG